VIVLEFAGKAIALTDEEFEAARERGLELMATPAPHVDDEILDAAGMEARTGVPASWWAESARKNTVPNLRLGKYVRFRLRDVLVAAKAKCRRLSSVEAPPGNKQQKPRMVS
jgi:hypothetical protein